MEVRRHERNTREKAQNGPQETRNHAGDQGLTAREKAALTAIEDWYRRRNKKENA